MRLNDISIRDPFILVHDGRYYMYGTRVDNDKSYGAWGQQIGFDVYVSDDLENWSEPRCVLEKNGDFWATMDFWAPEVHAYNGRFYMLATFKAPGRHRATHILVSDTPDGTFVPVSPDPATPADWESLDGTLYIDKNGDPYIIFCHEWAQIGDGTVCATKLSRDLTAPLSEPRVLWRASDFEQVQTVRPGTTSYVTDGPFLHRCQNGNLLAVWSTFNKNGYVELVSRSDNGDVSGNWTLDDQPLSAEDGGHGMIFRGLDGQLRFVMHRPNTPTLERPVLLPLSEQDGVLTLQ